MGTAFVLSGGSVKGAFQAGALEVILENGKVPSFVSTISVGTLNGIWLANEAGKIVREQTKLDWPALGKGLTAFWTENVRRPSDLVRVKSGLRLLWELAIGPFDGSVGTEPLRALVERTIDKQNLAKSPFDLRLGAVDHYKGTITYYDKDDPEIISRMMGSSAIPVAMPASVTGDEVLFDGGVRDVAPLKPAMKSGASEIIVIACQPRDVRVYPPCAAAIYHRDIRKLAERMTDIATNEIVNADIEYAEEINEIARQGKAEHFEFSRGKTERQLLVIRPSSDPEVDITSFTENDIKKMMDLGRNAAREALGRATVAA
jgi:NTE family protein